MVEGSSSTFLARALAAHMVLGAPLIAQNDLIVGLVVSRECVVADS